mmetsp:Transcript_12872/g.32433  ORF Transcript_12872/g.32433 Transcript_12872/m.32433 type:complete len:81 (-) Transcript_12872:348-590(-)
MLMTHPSRLPVNPPQHLQQSILVRSMVTQVELTGRQLSCAQVPPGPQIQTEDKKRRSPSVRSGLLLILISIWTLLQQNCK